MMSGGRSKVKTLTTVFVLKTKKLDDHCYPYWEGVSTWETSDHAYTEMKLRIKNLNEPRIYERDIYVSHTGQVWNGEEIVFTDGKWVKPEYDPRNSDPRFKTYLELKEEFGE
jgi:hypothetical protein